MATAKGIVTLKGSIGNVTFTDTPNGQVAYEKSAIDPQRLATDPKFENLRLHALEFGRAGKTGSLIRKAFRECLVNSRDSKMSSRLTGVLLKIIKKDPGNDKGMRKITPAELPALEGFEFNLNAPITNTLFAPYTTSIDRTAGEVKITFTGFVPSKGISTPTKATHFRIEAAVGEFNFDELKVTAEVFSTDGLALDDNNTGPIDITLRFTPNSTQPLLVGLGLDFYELVNNKFYPKSTASNVFAIVKVSG